MTPLAPRRGPSGGAWRGRFAALGLSLAIHGAAAAALLLAADDDLPAPGGAISVELIATLPGGSAGAHTAAAKPAPEPDDAARESAPEEPEPPELAETATHEPAEPETPAAEDTPPAPEPAPTDAPVTPASEAPGDTAAKPKAAPEAARRLAEAARPKLADRPSAKAEPRPRPKPKPYLKASSEPKPAPKLPPRPEPRQEAAAGPSGAAADAPEVAAVERTAPGFAVGSGANPLPDYPYRARRLGHQGRVVLKVAVSPNGTPVEVEIARSSGHDSLDDAARDTVRRWRFTPARVAGVPVAGTVEVPITFRLVGERGR